MNPYRLVVFAEEGLRLHDMEGEQWVIGRDENCEIRISDPSVSRRHVLLTLEEERFKIRDLGGKNPVLVGGKAVTEAEIAPGSEFVVGNTRMRLEPLEQGEIVVDEALRQRKRTTTVYVLPESPTTTVDVKLATLEHIAGALADAGDSEELARHALEVLFRALPVKRGFIAGIDERGDVRRIAIRNQIDPAGDVSIPKALLTRVVSEGKPILVSDASRAAARGGQRVRSQMAAPLKLGSRIAGLLYADDPAKARSFTPFDLHFMAVLARLVASRLETLDLIARLRQENIQIRTWIGREEPFVAGSHSMQPILEALRRLGPSRMGVFFVGEPGCGKESLARELHRTGGEPLAPFVVVHCAGLDSAQAERELFGRGGQRLVPHGKVTAAHGGTLYLHEPERLSEKVQGRLADLLESGLLEMRNRAAVRFSVRLAAGSRHRPEDLGRRGLLARELQDQLCGAVLEVPPLRRRPEDIPLLVQAILERLAHVKGGKAPEISAQAMQRLIEHNWPGNIRELSRVVESAYLMSDGGRIGQRHLPPELREGRAVAPRVLRTLEEVEREHVEAVLRSVGGNRVRAAQVLGIATSTLYEKLRRFEGEA
jgi:Nif-specific regulatory protein